MTEDAYNGVADTRCVRFLFIIKFLSERFELFYKGILFEAAK